MEIRTCEDRFGRSGITGSIRKSESPFLTVLVPGLKGVIGILEGTETTFCALIIGSAHFEVLNVSRISLANGEGFNSMGSAGV